MNEQLCPCGSEKALENCCGRFLNGAQAWPDDPETLMRARYTAHDQKDIAFLKASYAQDKRDEINWDYLQNWVENTEFLKLEISNPEVGQSEATLELIAHYREAGKNAEKMHEISLFRKIDDRWYFYDAKPPEVKTVRRETPKVGRNEPCPCGSGKKFKKCHGVVQ